ncbi:DMT family transporter [Brucella pseudintermedia]|uniref:DMT family transporter n=1 Tax=Brucella pseudintermedia TaxID=370111 RepID=UPI00124DE039|nr:EamA family transporter [Brucella pseudintermedia]KAB2680923.1 EamA family transporter [Brucella pseudintermedia]
MTMRTAPQILAPLLVCLGAFLWGTVGIASKVLYGIEDVPPLVLGFFRLAIAVPALLVWCSLRLGAQTFRFPGADAVRIGGLGLAMALYQVCYFRAVAEIGVALATLITICSAPILVGLLAPLLLRERITRHVAFALFLGLVGAALLVGAPPETGSATGIAWAGGSAIAYACFVLCSRTLAHHDPGKIIVVGFGTGALLLLPFALMTQTDFGSWPASAWLTLLYIGLVPTALAYVAYFRGMRGTAATPATILTLAEPLTATIIAVGLFGERLPPPALGGGALLLAALVLLVRRPAAA